MLTAILRKFCAGIATACLMATSHAQELDSLWQLRVMDLQQKLRVEVKIRLTNQAETGSCMGGHWKRVLISEKTLNDEKFFPLTDPLAYEIEQGRITLGRITMCDNYLLLAGKLNNKTIRGGYHGPGPKFLGPSQQLGYFSLTKIR